MYIVEFSISQKAFHKQTLSEMCTQNFKNILLRKQTDYVPIAAFRTEDQANDFINETYEKIKDYSMYYSLGGQIKVMD